MAGKAVVKTDQVKDSPVTKKSDKTDHVASLVSYVAGQKNSRALTDTLESWFVHVQGRVTTILSEHNKAITELPNTEDLDGLLRWTTEAFKLIGQYSKHSSTVKNAMVVGAYRLSSDHKLVTGDMLKFRNMVCDAMDVKESTRKQIRALTSTYPQTALLVEQEKAPLSIYRILAKTASQWDSTHVDPQEMRVHLDAYTKHFIDQYNKPPNYTNMTTHLEEVYNPTDTALQIVKDAQRDDIIRRKAHNVLAGKGTLDDIKSADRQERVKAEIETILNNVGYMVHNPRDVGATITRYTLSFADWSEHTNLVRLRDQLRILYTLVENKVRLDSGIKDEHDATRRNPDQWPVALDNKIVDTLESEGLTPYDVSMMSADELCKIKGIGKATAKRIMASIA